MTIVCTFLFMITTTEGKRRIEGDQENPWTQGPLLPQEHNLSPDLSIIED
jgi:hypothetical protein